MGRFLLTRILPIIAGFAILISGTLLLQQPVPTIQGLAGWTIKIEGKSMFLKPSKLKLANAPFKGTDLEPFDMEAATTAREVLAALKKSYPSKVTSYGYDREHDDWFITVGQKKFLWAKGRILPPTEAADADQWRPIVDYLYPKEAASPETFSRELVDEIRRTSQPEFRARLPSYHLDFFDSLYNGKTRKQMESHIDSTLFLGKAVDVHQDIVQALLTVEKKIVKEAKRNQEVQDFINTIGGVEGYNWREIRDRKDRSFHSWGLAVDILPKGWRHKHLYWNWSREQTKDWMLIPLSQRWMPPKAVVDIFEQHGFIWGGKWMLWDTIHFEYRPELLVLRGR